MSTPSYDCENDAFSMYEEWVRGTKTLYALWCCILHNDNHDVLLRLLCASGHDKKESVAMLRNLYLVDYMFSKRAVKCARVLIYMNVITLYEMCVRYDLSMNSGCQNRKAVEDFFRHVLDDGFCSYPLTLQDKGSGLSRAVMFDLRHSVRFLLKDAEKAHYIPDGIVNLFQTTVEGFRLCSGGEMYTYSISILMNHASIIDHLKAPPEATDPVLDRIAKTAWNETKSKLLLYVIPIHLKRVIKIAQTLKATGLFDVHDILAITSACVYQSFYGKFGAYYEANRARLSEKLYNRALVYSDAAVCALYGDKNLTKKRAEIEAALYETV